MPHQIPVSTAEQARARLDAGNAMFRRLGEDGAEHVITAYPIAASVDMRTRSPLHEPFAAVIGCSDARVPVEFIFGQAANDLFVVRVAGNVLATGVTGSIQYAVENLPTVKMVVVLAHTSCGGLATAVDALLEPESYLDLAHTPELRAVVDSLLVGVRLAARTMGEVGGPAAEARPDYRTALIDLSAVANAAISAHILSGAIAPLVTFGTFDLNSRSVGIAGADGWVPGLADAPADNDALERVLADYARWLLSSREG